MLPLLFGEPTAPLFGALHPGASPRRDRAVLIAAPAGWEALRAHRTLRLLADRLADAGFDAFRFDYSGTGDSAGVEADATLDAWLQDFRLAHDELEASTGSRLFAIVGLRIGADLAQAYAAQMKFPPRLVLWSSPGEAVAEDSGLIVGDDTERALGVPPRVAAALRARTSAGDGVPADRLLVLHDDPGRRVAGAEWRSTAGTAPCWVEERHHGAGAAPIPLLEAIVDWLCRAHDQ